MDKIVVFEHLLWFKTLYTNYWVISAMRYSLRHCLGHWDCLQSLECSAWLFIESSCSRTCTLRVMWRQSLSTKTCTRWEVEDRLGLQHVLSEHNERGIGPHQHTHKEHERWSHWAANKRSRNREKWRESKQFRASTQRISQRTPGSTSWAHSKRGKQRNYAVIWREKKGTNDMVVIQSQFHWSMVPENPSDELIAFDDPDGSMWWIDGVCVLMKCLSVCGGNRYELILDRVGCPKEVVVHWFVIGVPLWKRSDRQRSESRWQLVAPSKIPDPFCWRTFQFRIGLETPGKKSCRSRWRLGFRRGWWWEARCWCVAPS